MTLQGSSADVSLAVKVVVFFRRLSRAQPVLRNRIYGVLSKWINGNAVVNVITNNFGEFLDACKDYISSQTVGVQEPSADRAYNERAENSFADFVYQQDESIFQVKNHLNNLKPTSADVELIFSLGRFKKLSTESNV